MLSKQPFKLLYIILATWLTFACKQADHADRYPPTNAIDKSIYKQLFQKFRVSLSTGPDYLGGLTPNYPIAVGSQLLYDFQGKRLTPDKDWTTGGFFPQAQKIVIKIKNDYILIKSRKELQKVYAPISSEQEALAYAILYNRSFAAFNDFFEKKKYEYIGDKPAISYAMKKGNHYEVHLFSYQTFGCDHPYFSEIFEVDNNGFVKMVSKVRSFYDPADKFVCVD